MAEAEELGEGGELEARLAGTRGGEVEEGALGVFLGVAVELRLRGGEFAPDGLLKFGGELGGDGEFGAAEDVGRGLRAEALVEEGCLWNTGNFMFRAGSLIAQAAIHAPDMLKAVEASVALSAEHGNVCELGVRFTEAPRVSFDIAIMEKTNRAAVIPIDYAWSDLGSWDSVLAFSELDGAGNSVVGTAVLSDSEGCLVRAGTGIKIVAIGLRNLAVVVSGGNILISDLARVSALKPALEALESLGDATDGDASVSFADGASPGSGGPKT